MSLYQAFLNEAYRVAKHSPDPSTQNGAIIVQYGDQYPNGYNIIGSACNTFPEGVQSTPERLERPLKYSYVEHAERGAVYDAAKRGQSTNGATMFVPWFACADCGRAIIRSGIRKVVGHKAMMDKTPPHWKESIEAAMTMLKEAGVILDFYEGVVFGDAANGVDLLFNGELWRP